MMTQIFCLNDTSKIEKKKMLPIVSMALIGHKIWAVWIVTVTMATTPHWQNIKHPTQTLGVDNSNTTGMWDPV